MSFLDRERDNRDVRLIGVATPDQSLRITPAEPGRYDVVAAGSKKEGMKWWGNPAVLDITGDFAGKGSAPKTVTIDRAQLLKLATLVQRDSALRVMGSLAGLARKYAPRDTRGTDKPSFARNDEGSSNEQTASGIRPGLPARHTAATARLAAKLNRWLESKGIGQKFRALEISHAELRDSAARGLSAIERALGVRVHIIRNLTPEVESFRGITFRDGDVFVDENASRPVVTVALHEFTHNLRRTDPDLYARIEAEVRAHADLPRWYKDYAQNVGPEGFDKDVATEELAADAVGDALSDHEFLDKMAKRNPAAFADLARRILDFLGRLVGKLRDLGSNRYLRDVQAFRDKLADVLDEYAKRRNAGGGSDEPPRFSRERDPNDHLIDNLPVPEKDAQPHWDGEDVELPPRAPGRPRSKASQRADSSEPWFDMEAIAAAVERRRKSGLSDRIPCLTPFLMPPAESIEPSGSEPTSPET